MLAVILCLQERFTKRVTCWFLIIHCHERILLNWTSNLLLTARMCLLNLTTGVYTIPRSADLLIRLILEFSPFDPFICLITYATFLVKPNILHANLDFSAFCTLFYSTLHFNIYQWFRLLFADIRILQWFWLSRGWWRLDLCVKKITTEDH